MSGDRNLLIRKLLKSSRQGAALNGDLMIKDIDHPIDPREFHDRIYKGDILCFRQLPQMKALVDATRRRAVDAVSGHDPTLSHTVYSKTDLINRFSAYQGEYLKDSKISALWRTLFEAMGLAADKTAIDRRLARVQTPVSTSNDPATDLVTAPLAFHRDTWASNLYAQVNWWAPLYQVTAGRTMEIYPSLWDRELSNTTKDFDLPAVITMNRKAARTHRNANAVIPHLTAPVSGCEPVPALVEPGDILAFSGAHAHASVPNHTKRTRLSLETRTVWIDDLISGRGAPNIDGNAKWMAPGWFRRMTDSMAVNDIMGVDPVIPYTGKPTAVT